MAMASITIRNLYDNGKILLCRRAADNDRSMEEEARLIPRDASARKSLQPTANPLRGLSAAELGR